MPIEGVSPANHFWLAGLFLKARFFQAVSGTSPFFWLDKGRSNTWPSPKWRATSAILSGPQKRAHW